SERCNSSCSRSDTASLAAPPCASSDGTLGGGGGGGVASRLSRIHLPRLTGEVRVGFEVTVKMLACPNSPARGVPASETWRNSLPETPSIPYSLASGSLINV